MISMEKLGIILKRHLPNDEILDDYTISSTNMMFREVLATSIEIYGPEAVLFALRWGHEVESVINDIPVSKNDGLYIIISKLTKLSEKHNTKWVTIARAYLLLLCLWSKAEFLPDSLDVIRRILNHPQDEQQNSDLPLPYSSEI